MSTTRTHKAPTPRPVVRSQVEPRLVERRRRVVEERRRRRKRQVVAAVCLVAVVAAAAGTLASPLTDVDRVRVTGTERLSNETVVGSAGIETGDQMVSLDLAAARERLRDLPLVAGARVVREWPSTVHVDVVEEVPVVRMRSGDVERVVSRSGRVLPDGLDGVDGLPVLEVSGVDLVEGESLGENLHAAVGVFTRIPDALRPTLASASVDDAGNLTFHLEDDASVRFGPVEDVPAKLAATHAFLTQVVQECLDVVDVRQPDLVTASRRSDCVAPAPTEVAATSGAGTSGGASSGRGTEAER